MKHIIIIGAGPAGLSLAMNLSQNKNRKITIIEKSKYPGGSWKSYFIDNKYFCEHSPQVLFNNYDRFFKLLEILKINTNNYIVNTSGNLLLFYFKMLKFLIKYFTISDFAKMFLAVIDFRNHNTKTTIEDIVNKYQLSTSARKAMTIMALAAADIPEKVLFKNILFIASGYLIQINDKNLFVNKIIEYLKLRNVNIILNSKVVGFENDNGMISFCKYSSNNKLFKIKGDEFIMAIPPIPIYNIIRTNPITMNNWEPINDFKKWAMYSSYYSIGFQMHFTEKLPWIDKWGWTINSPWYIIGLPVSNFIKEYTRDPSIKTVWSFTIIDGNYISPRINKTTNQCSLEEIKEEALHQLSQEYGSKLEPKVFTFNPSVKYKNNKYTSSGSGVVITKLGTIDFQGKIPNLFTVGCHTIDEIATMEMSLKSSMMFCSKYYSNDKILLEPTSSKFPYIAIMIILLLIFYKWKKVKKILK